MTETFAADREYLLQKYRRPIEDGATGLADAEVARRAVELGLSLSDQPHAIAKARAFELVTRSIRLELSPHDFFPRFGCWDRYKRPLKGLLAVWQRELDDTYVPNIAKIRELTAACALWAYPDFDHSVPDWDAVLSLGLPGLRERALSSGSGPYYEAIRIEYGAAIGLLKRVAELGEADPRGDERVRMAARCARALAERPPKTFYEALYLIFFFFYVGEHLDHVQVRSLGNLDRMLYPYYRRDLDSGEQGEERLRELLDHFMMQFASINNYVCHPFYLAGTRADGQSEVNPLSYVILEEYDRLDVTTPKIHVKLAENTPREFVDSCLRMIRRGHSSVAFVGEPCIYRALLSEGYSEEDARTCDIRGCYEYVPRGKSVITGGCYINLLKPMEWALNGGLDPVSGKRLGLATPPAEELNDFGAFFAAYLRQLDALLDEALTAMDACEARLGEYNPEAILAATYIGSVRSGVFPFAGGTAYDNSAVLLTGTASVADALTAVRKFVYDSGEMRLCDLRDVLNANWSGAEALRRRILNDPEKFGNNIERADAYADAVARHCAMRLNMRPNARGGHYLSSLHAADTFQIYGRKTGATPDGRALGEEMSKNASPVMGMDRSGVTAMLQSALKLYAPLYSGDFAVDVMLHPTSVAGEEGLSAMRALLETYIRSLGHAIQFNIYSAEMLEDAQRRPEKYQSLQVRVCGWNVPFHTLEKREQDTYILRARNILE